MLTFQQIIQKLNDFWSKQGCVIGQPYGLEVGAGTANPHTFFRVLGPEPFSVAYVEPSRRPQDGRYGENPNRFQHYYQYQIILKPAPKFNQELYIESLMEIGIDPTKHDLRFVEDNWESTPLGAWGLGWEVWLDGMEITQYTYFQQMAGINMEVPPLEITFGLERIAMYIQGVDDYRDLMWNENVRYADLFEKHEHWQSKFNYEESNIDALNKMYAINEQSVEDLLEKGNYWAAYDNLLKVSHTFNLLDSRGAVSLSDRIYKFKQMQRFSKAIGQMYLEERKKMKYPLARLSQAITYEPKQIKIRNKKSESNTYILELNFEEIPASYLSKWNKICSNKWLNDILDEYEYERNDAKIYFSPRRIVVQINDAAEYAEDKQQLFGPPVEIAYMNNKPSDVLRKFLKKNSATEKDIVRVDRNGKEFVQISIVKKTALTEIVQEVVNRLMKAAPQQKFMRWDENEENVFIRPLRSIVSYHNDKKVDVAYFGVKPGDITYGPRYINPGIAKIKSAQEYLSFIDQFGIELDEEKRNKLIRSRMNKSDAFTYSENMISENTFLTESPKLKFIELDKRFKKLPYKLVEKVLEDHQRYIVRESKSSKKIEYGPVVNGNEATQLILDGNKKVANARLDDGLFYYDLDKDVALESLRPKLANIGFHPKQGTYLKKVSRVESLVKHLYKKVLKKSMSKELKSALKLLKNDKASNLGAEFPDLEGYIGRFLAKEQGIGKKVGNILFEHYLPQSINDDMPTSEEARYLSLIDKLDSLITLSSVEGFPEGNDPYEIRKFARNLLELLVVSKLDIDLEEIVRHSYEILGKNNAYDNLLNFINKRFYQRITQSIDKPEFNNYLQGVAYSHGSNYYQKTQFAYELVDVLKDKDTADKVFDAIKRVHNILNSSKDKVVETKDNLRFSDESANALFKFVVALEKKSISPKDLIKLSGLLELYFENVMVMDKDTSKRAKNLALIRRVYDVVNRVYRYE